MQGDAVAAIVELTIKNAVAPLVAELADVRRRLAAYEAREPIPGPPGPPGRDGVDGADGQPGANGANGTKGADGFGFDDLTVAFDGMRTLTLAFQRGDDRRAFPIILPYLRYVGVFEHGAAYHVGDVVTHGGSAWHCEADTTRAPHDGAGNGREWKLMVKRGRDGKRE